MSQAGGMASKAARKPMQQSAESILKVINSGNSQTYQSDFSGSRPGHAFPTSDQGAAEGNAAGR
jgi:hypothetical protein